LKEKVSEITSRIELRNTEMIKKSMKNLKEEGSHSDLTRRYGFSIFSKKFSQTMKESEKIKEKSRSQDSKESERDEG
jgi:hypothetical protein